MTRVIVLSFISLLLGTYFALEPVTTQEYAESCPTRPCSPPYNGPCCNKKNIAWNSSNTNQSSQYESYPSKLAVDGNIDTDFNSNTCTHTDDPEGRNAYWMINLESTYNISELKLYLRNIIAPRYNGLSVQVNSTECFRLNKTFSSGDTPLEDQIQHIHCSPPVPGSVVSVTVNHTMLTLCEVQIFVCDRGWYGEECDRQCNCRDSTDCDKETGWCRDGCRAGKHGDGCQCDCPNGTYGLDCKESCGYCLEGNVCDKTNGSCDSGCAQGFIAPLCQECDDFYHKRGNSCEECGFCEDNMPCYTSSGKCSGNCQAGYEQPFCETGCDDGKFGINCLSNCGRCVGNHSCNKTDGTCQNGCQEHFIPPMCKDCVSGRYGTDCQSMCGQCADNVTCNREGTCTSGCIPGFTGELCEIRVEKDSPNLIPIAAGVCAAIVLLITLIVVGIVILKRRRLQKKPITMLANSGENPKDTSCINTSEPSVTKQSKQPKIAVKASTKSQETEKSPMECVSTTRPKAKKSTKTPANQEQEDILVEAKPDVCPTETPCGGNEYYSVIPTPITLPKLAQYIKDRINGVGFENEFKLLPYGIHDDHDEGKKPENKKRNRFLELYPYDHSRVVLEPEHDAAWDYINANYINGYRDNKTFIAAQGPNLVTVDDFWRMIWQQGVTKFVMVTRLMELTKKKCEQYWSDDEEMREFGNIKVHNKYSTVRRDCTIRTFKVKHSDDASESREVTQLHFTSWPDHDVPSTPALVSFWKHFRRLLNEVDTEPVVVHCSAGVGRTGTFIALDLLFEEAEREGKLNR